MSDTEGQQVTHLKDAQRQTYRARLLFDRVRHGLRDVPIETAKREWQTALLGYHSEIQRYKHTRNLEDVWYEPISEKMDMSLDELSEWAFADDEVTHEFVDAATMRKTKETEIEPLVYTAEELRQIQIKLDECYHELGFDEPPKTVQQHGGTIGDEAEELFPEFDEETVNEIIEEVDRLIEAKRDESGSAAEQVPAGTSGSGT
jgi:hypothetical protein